MSYVTSDTIWPTPALNDKIKQLIAMFYQLADIQSSDAGPRMASEVFTEDASMITPAGTFQGSKNISSSRENVWKGIASREHRVAQVFTADPEGVDVMLTGTLNLAKENGDVSLAPFACYFKFDESSVKNGDPRLTLARVYLVRQGPSLFVNIVSTLSGYITPSLPDYSC
ncbi:hypothetical protein FOVG_16668 [Fusarium oxysporum f. sp. pisi HDV247]|uniref:SnoaL-like domain-containing protein n=1 Tax=Fusarium oxysporum f. sp. pisi HDV247 TaxID=1080344 RepID=W9NMX6_FUSOX|nr:hypothetical protein FOVG_16668 [Fusarium oxysporum f. sp. pisi HDV247]